MSSITAVLLAGALLGPSFAASAGSVAQTQPIPPVSHAHSYRHHAPRRTEEHRADRVHREFEPHGHDPYPYFFYYYHHQPRYHAGHQRRYRYYR